MGGKMNRPQQASALFDNGLCCSQSVLSVFAEWTDIDTEKAARIAAPFCGGIAHTGAEVCGAVSGGIMAIAFGYNSGDLREESHREIADQLVSKYLEKFRQKHGSIRCRELLGYEIGKEEELEKVREKNLFETICRQLVESSVEIVEDIMQL
jgi:C_GCAxxG_C_C family probable redox protein